MNSLQYPVMFSPKQDINMPQEKQHPAEMILQFWQKLSYRTMAAIGRSRGKTESYLKVQAEH